MMLSQRGDETVDIFSLRGSKVAEQFRLALQMYIKDQSLNPLTQTAKGYIGGVSKTDMLANNSDLDNNIITNPYNESNAVFPAKPFEV